MLLLVSNSAVASKKVALVIGNNQYDNVPDLQKAISDANTISGVLKRTGFEVIEAHDLSRRSMNYTIEGFLDKVSPGDTAMLYYAGHGIEIDGQNYLLPVDVPANKAGDEDIVKFESVSLNLILDRLRKQHADINIVVLDACRDNPFKQGNNRGVGSTRGLASINAPKGTFIMYSAGAGEAALDALNDTDPNPNSVFTRVLAPMIEKPNINLPSMAREVRRQVRKLAGTVRHQQTPAYYDEMLGDFYFINVNVQKAGNVSVTTAPVSPNNGSVARGDSMELAYWNAIKDSDDAELFESYIQKFPAGYFVFLAGNKIEALKQNNISDKMEPVVVAGGVDIDGLLEECETHFNSNRLTSGTGGTALECYKEVLDIRPNQSDALAGIEKIENQYIVWMKREIEQNNAKKAQRYLKRLQTINPEHSDIEALETAINGLKYTTRPVDPSKPVAVSSSLIAGIYRDNGDGTVTDIRTDLQWMRCSLGQHWTGSTCNGVARKYSYIQALDAGREATNNRTGGHLAWRVPSKGELLTLVYCSSGQPEFWKKTSKLCEGSYTKPTINTVAFPETPASFFWSASPSANNSGPAWYVNFYSGHSGNGNRWNDEYVRLVRSGQ